MNDEEIDVDAVMHRLQVNGWAERTSSALSNAEDQKVLKKLLGTREAERYQRTKGRPYRYRPPIVTAEYYECPPDEFRNGGGWKIDVLEDGVRRNSKSGLSKDDCFDLIRRLQRRGVRAQLIVTESMKHEQRRQAETKNVESEKQPCQSGKARFLLRYGWGR